MLVDLYYAVAPNLENGIVFQAVLPARGSIKVKMIVKKNLRRPDKTYRSYSLYKVSFENPNNS